MKRSQIFWQQTGALIRKDGKSLSRQLPAVLLLLLLLCVGCVSLCMTVIQSVRAEEDRLSIGIVDKDGSMVSKLAIGLVAANDQIKALFDVKEFDSAQEAYDAVAAGETVAAMVFEEGYMDKIRDGESSAVSVVLSREMEVHSQTIRQFTATGEILIKTAEYNAAAAWHPVHDAYPNDTEALIKFNFFSTKFAVELLSLTGKAVDGVILPYSDRANSVEGHYILYYLVLLLVLTDMLFFDFVRRDNSRTLLCRMKSAGISTLQILLAKVPFLLAAKGGLLVAALAVLGWFVPVVLTPATIAAAFGALLFTSLMGVALCALVQRSDVGPCILCALGFAGLFLCGGLIPYDVLPQSITAWGQYTHVGVMAGLLCPVFGGQVRLLPLALACVMLIVLLPAGCWATARLRTKGCEQL